MAGRGKSGTRKWGAEAGAPVHEVKDIRSGEQVAADPASWMPPAEDLHVQIVRAEGL